MRARYLYALARQIQKHSRLFAVLETLDNGKPIRESRDLDVPLVARHFAYHAGWAQVMAEELPGYAPLGVVGQIIPWNFPLLMLAWKVAPALAMGNTVVLKPAEFTPLTALLFAEITQAVGLPAGVFNIVTGDGDTGAALVNHPDVDKIAFTGSTEVGRIIRQATAGTGKRLSLELGGKSPFVVFDDADLDGAVEGLVDAIWFNQGQVCCAGSRLLVQESIEQLAVDQSAHAHGQAARGRPDGQGDRHRRHRRAEPARTDHAPGRDGQSGRRRGVAAVGRCPVDGWFYPPTLVTGVGPASELAQVEIFGPVLVAMSFRTPAEAVALANNTRYGLAASIWTQDIDQALDVARGIQAGTVWVNSTNLFDASSGFGGYRESGFGREGGREGLYEYVRRGPSGCVRTPHGGGFQERTNRGGQPDVPPIDRTPKLYIGGKQARPDSGYSRTVYSTSGQPIGEVGDGNRKDIRNAVEAARAALGGWSGATGYNRAQVLYYVAENLAARSAEFGQRLKLMTGSDGDEVERGDRASVHVRRVRRQVRRQRAPAAAARRGAGGARTDRCRRRGLPERRAVTRPGRR